MPVSSAVRERVRPFLLPDEEIRYVLPASMPSVALMSAHFLVVVTDASIVVLSTGVLSRTNPRSVWGRYPRSTRMGPVDTSLTPSFSLGGTFFEVDEEYVSVINAADAELASPDTLPPDPLPDL
ncbi:MAG: hypothetical protein GEV03_27335 [Streptosporangiales bacterium]|nr:hypothetical protein [Streptosporangiales bacterium]